MSQKPTKQVAKRKATKQRRVESRELIEDGYYYAWWDYDGDEYYFDGDRYGGDFEGSSDPWDHLDPEWSLKRPHWMARLDALRYLPTAWERLLETPF